MFAIPGIVLLVVQAYTRPQEFVEALRQLPFLYLFLGLALFGYAVDLRLRRTRPVAAPQLGWVLAFGVWALFSIGHRLPSEISTYAIDIAIPLTFFFLLAHAVQSFRGLSVLTGTVLVIALFLAGVGVHQGLSPFGCIKLDPAATDESGVWDGRSCTNERECEAGDAEPDSEYMCERVGLFGTSSVGGGRVRYRGSLNDPNELSLTLCVALPFAFAFFERKRSGARLLLLVVSVALIAVCTIMTKSRGGQLVFLAVLGTYFVKRFGARGLILGAIVAAPILLLGGRHGEGATESSQERIEMMYQAMQLFRWYPLRGVGFEQILEYNRLTAHNSYALAAAEMGFPGLVLWTSVLYASFKTVLSALARFEGDPAAKVARAWAMALLASLVGMSVGIFFLSFCYHLVFWVYMGLCGALYQACRAHDPTFTVKLDARDLWRLVGIDLALVVIIFAYTGFKVG